ncbi:HPr family phosphocarrier protein [uncultured Ruthenibacterium sp.]|uniref:HPr family phosphocarrier protein n=1 Tax=uncultured Ruthenibacterium sp. TaxID=1905347 RepID=UPI00349EEFD7
MVSAKVTVTNPMGLHMRPAQVFIREMTPFESEVTINYKDRSINGKSIMNLMASGIKQGAEIEIRCEGSDEQAALDKAVALIQSGLGE